MAIKQRTPRAEFDDIPGDVPAATLPDSISIPRMRRIAIEYLNNLKREHFAPTAVWRDLLSLTDTYRTYNSASAVFDVLQRLSTEKKRSPFRIDETRDARIGRSAGGSAWIDVDVLFTAETGGLTRNCMCHTGAGTVSLLHDDSNNRWQIWMLRTWLENFQDHGHPDRIDGVSTAGTNNGDIDATSVDASKKIDPYGAVVIGGGQAGLAVGGRLHALGVSYVILENHKEVGDVWAERYESLKWHTTKEYGNLPFGHTYPEHDDKMLPAKRISAGHKAWTEKYRINVSTSTNVESADWDDTTKLWTIAATSPNGRETMLARNLVLAIGNGIHTPRYPSWATEDRVKSSGFRGTIMHSFVGYRSAHQWAGQRGIVVGTANTAHDIAEDMANANMHTTMIQRNPTFVFPVEWLVAAEDMHYHADLDPATADREAFTYPNKIMRQMVNQAVHKGIAANPDRFDALEKAGFKLDRFGDIYNNLYFRLGGHYVDIGCSARIASGEIGIKAKAVKGLTEDGLMFEDGEEIGADLIVLCTGFEQDFRKDAAKILGPGMAEQIDDFYGMDKEGEVRGHARPAGHPNLYYHGGDVRMARFYSRFIALQIQSDVLGIPIQPCRDSS